MIDRDLPRPGQLVDVVVPYERGDLISRVHRHGEVEAIDHEAGGTRVRARVARRARRRASSRGSYPQPDPGLDRA